MTEVIIFLLDFSSISIESYLINIEFQDFINNREINISAGSSVICLHTQNNDIIDPGILKSKIASREWYKILVTTADITGACKMHGKQQFYTCMQKADFFNTVNDIPGIDSKYICRKTFLNALNKYITQLYRIVKFDEHTLDKFDDKNFQKIGHCLLSRERIIDLKENKIYFISKVNKTNIYDNLRKRDDFENQSFFSDVITQITKIKNDDENNVGHKKPEVEIPEDAYSDINKNNSSKFFCAPLATSPEEDNETDLQNAQTPDPVLKLDNGETKTLPEVGTGSEVSKRPKYDAPDDIAFRLGESLKQNKGLTDYDPVFYIEPKCFADKDPSSFKLVSGLIEAAKEKKFIILHSGPGGGKTFALRQIYRMVNLNMSLVNNYKSGNDDKICIVVPLKAMAAKLPEREFTSDQFINAMVSAFADEFAPDDADIVQQLIALIRNKSWGLIVCLDALDEFMESRRFEIDAQKNFIRAIEEELLSRGFTVILSSRTNYLHLFCPFGDFIKEISSQMPDAAGNYKMSSISICPLEPDDVKFLIMRYGIHKGFDTDVIEVANNTFFKIRNEFEFLISTNVLGLPLMATMFLRTIFDGVNDRDVAALMGRAEKVRSISEFYSMFINSWIMRSLYNKNNAGIENHDESKKSVGSYLEAMKYAALSMQNCADECFEVSAGNKKKPDIKKDIILKFDKDYRKYMIKGLLKYGRSGNIEFVHESFFHYFIYRSLLDLFKTPISSAYNDRELKILNYPIPDLVIAFLADGMNEEELENLCRFFNDHKGKISNDHKDLYLKLAVVIFDILCKYAEFRKRKLNMNRPVEFWPSNASEVKDEIMHEIIIRGISDSSPIKRTFSGIVFHGADIRPVEGKPRLIIENKSFDRMIFKDCVITDVDFKNCDFKGRYPNEGSFDNAIMVNVNFYNCSIVSFPVRLNEEKSKNVTFIDTPIYSSDTPMSSNEILYINNQI